MKSGGLLTLILAVIIFAYGKANYKMTQKTDLGTLRLQMTLQELKDHFGPPTSRHRNFFTYILEDSSQLHVTLRDDVVTSAIVKFHRPIRIEDPQMKQLTLVQMAPASLQDENTSWFYAGKPEEGLIYKITDHGVIESITWVPPFSYGSNRPKNLQALLRDFKGQHLSNL